MNASAVGEPIPASLWRNRSFLRLWVARAISGLGSRITATAIPLTAAITLQATPGQMAMLVVAGQLPDLLFGLLAGAWVDRRRHRPILIGADLGRAALLAIIPFAAFAGALSFPLLVAVAFGSGVLSVFFAVASVAVLPSVVRPDQLIEANAKLSMSESVLSLTGPGLAGTLITLLTAPKAILVDALSYVASAWSLGRVGTSQPARVGVEDGEGTSLLRDIRDGLRELIATPLLRALTLSSVVFAVGLAMQATVLMLFLTRSLALSPATIGLVLACGGAGSLIGATLAGRMAGRFGAGRAIIGGTLIESLAAFSIPFSLFAPEPVPVLIAGQMLNGFGLSVYAVNHISLRQRIVAPHYLGRITAGRRFLTFSVAPLGAILGSWLGSTVGFVPTLTAASIFLLAGTLVMWTSPVRYCHGMRPGAT